MNESPIIVIDNGSYAIKGGLAGIFEPSYTFPSHVAKFHVTKHHTEMYAGNDIVKSPQGSTISKVFDNNNIDWNGLEKLYQHLLYDKLTIDQDKHKLPHHIAMQRKNKIFLTNSPFTSNKIKSKMCQLLFEKFDCDGAYFGITSTCSLYSVGKTTGVVVDSGYKSTYVAPVFEGYMLPLFAKKLNYGGYTLDCLLRDLINSKQSFKFTKRERKEITISEAEKIKIDTSFVKMEFNGEDMNASQASTTIGTSRSAPSVIHSKDYPIKYALPDGKEIAMIELFAERFQPAELMFQPDLFQCVKDQQALPYAIHQAVTRGDHVFHKEMFKNIVLSGGNSMITGMKQRLYKDVTNLVSAAIKVEIDASPQRGYAAWTGASVMAAQSEMEDIWITPELYREEGPYRCLNIRCF